jgi:hypothetical protein
LRLNGICFADWDVGSLLLVEVILLRLTEGIHHQQAIHVEQTGSVGATFVDDNLAGPAVVRNRIGKECGRCRLIAVLR